MTLFTELEGFITGKIGLVKTLASLMKLEARLAGLSVYPVLLQVCLLFTLLTTTWATAMMLVGYWFLSLSGSLLVSLLLVFLIHLALLIGFAGLLQANLQRMSFAKTRHYLNSFKDEPHGQIPQKTD